MSVDFNAMMQTATTLLTTVGLKVLGAIAIWIVGRWLISLALRLIGSALTKQKVDPTLIRYIHSAVAALLNIVLVVAILGFFGVETTSFAALLAAAGVAIGMAVVGTVIELRRRRVSGDPAALQGGRLHHCRRNDRHGRGHRLVCHYPQYPRQRKDHRR